MAALIAAYGDKAVSVWTSSEAIAVPRMQPSRAIRFDMMLGSVLHAELDTKAAVDAGSQPDIASANVNRHAEMKRLFCFILISASIGVPSVDRLNSGV